MIYCGKCYCSENNYPFGFCESCWIKAGKPKSMKVSKVDN